MILSVNAFTESPWLGSETTRIVFIAMKDIASTGRRSKEHSLKPWKDARNADGSRGRAAHNPE
jgi:hypothetical protein